MANSLCAEEVWTPPRVGDTASDGGSSLSGVVAEDVALVAGDAARYADEGS
jgi:hypothetical protein